MIAAEIHGCTAGVPVGHISLRKRFGVAQSKLTNATFGVETTVTDDCDIVIQIPRLANDDFTEWLCNKIRQSCDALRIKVSWHEASQLTNILCTVTVNGLLRSAEELGIKKRLKQEFGGQVKEFSMKDVHLYENSCGAEMFTTQEKQHIALHMLNNIRFVRNEHVSGNVCVEGQAVLPRMLTLQLVSQVYPLHSHADLNRLRNDWVFDFTAQQPLDAVKDYFGVHIGMYFAYLGHYTAFMCLPALLGVFIWFYSGIDQNFDDVSFIGFAFFNVIWSTIYIELWKRKEAEHAYRWGTLDKQDDLITEPRPLYRGDLQISPVTGRLEPHYPRWRRNLFFYSVSMPIMILSHCVIIIVCFNFFACYDVIVDRIEKGQLPVIVKPFPNLCLALTVMAMDKVYQRIAIWLNNKENYRNEEEYKNQLIIKLMLFQSVNSFLSLLYTAFYIQDFSRLRSQLAMLFVVRQVLGNMKESLLSFVIAKVKQYQGAAGVTLFSVLECRGVHETSNQTRQAGASVSSVTDTCTAEEKSEKKSLKLTQAEAEGLLPRYDGTFEDYLEMIIQFGYVTWFSSVFPLAGLFALLNNIVEIRSDAFKLCMSFQRPFAERVKNIGAWQVVLELMSVGTIIVNTALIGISGPMIRMFPDLTGTQRFLLIVVMEHLVLALKFIIRMAIADVPEWVSIEMAKLEFQRREALRLKTQAFLCLDENHEMHQQSAHDATEHVMVSALVVEGHSINSSARNSPQKDILIRRSHGKSIPDAVGYSKQLAPDQPSADFLDHAVDNQFAKSDIGNQCYYCGSESPCHRHGSESPCRRCGSESPCRCYGCDIMSDDILLATID